MMLPKKPTTTFVSSIRGSIKVLQCAYISSATSANSESAAPLPPRPPRNSSLAGTVPHHTSYLLLHTRDPPSKWPSIFSSSLYLDLQRRTKEYGGLVNFCWQPEPEHQTVHDGAEEAYSATSWKISNQARFSRRFDIPVISKRNVGEVLEQIFHGDRRGEVADSGHAASSGPYFYVCTHGQRDCRCGIRGVELAEGLRRELSDRGMLFDLGGTSRVGEVGHVGGHKNAPNLLVFPHGDWYGNLEPSDIPGLLDHLFRSLQLFKDPILLAPLDGPNRPQWRGRMGMTKEEQTSSSGIL